MASTITTRIALKHALSAEWASSTLTALAGEYLFDSENKYIKVGDGVHTWKDLSTIRLPKEAVDGLQDVDTNTLYKLSADGTVLKLLSADGTAEVPAYAETGSQWDISSLISNAVDAEKQRAEAAEQGLAATLNTVSGAVDAEKQRAEAAEQGLAATLNTVSSDYLTSTDKTELENRDSAISNYVGTAVDAEKQRAEAAEQGLAATLNTVSSDYLTSTDKTELENRDSAISNYVGTFDASTVASTVDTVVKYIDYKVSGAAGAMRFRGAFEKLEDVTDPENGDVVIVGTKEYVYNGNATPAAWVEVGDEGAWDPKGAAATAELNAKNYTNAEIQKLDMAEVTVGADKTLASIKQEDGKVTTTAVAIQIAETQVTNLTSDLDTLSGMVNAEATRAQGVEQSLGATVAAEVAARAAADDSLSVSLVGTNSNLSSADTIWGAKKYADVVAAGVQANALSGVTLNNVAATVNNHVAAFEITCISCGGAN